MEPKDEFTQELRFPNSETSLNVINKWADYLEYMCLGYIDHYVTISDFIDTYTDHRPEEISRGGKEHSQKSDELALRASDCFKMLAVRKGVMGVHYPFIISNESIEMKENLSIENEIYLFLLCASNINYFTRAESYKLTHAFEEFCLPLMRSFFSPLASTEIFGTSRETGTGVYTGNLRTRLHTLATNLSTSTTLSFRRDTRFDVPAGDGGIDLVSYIQLDGHPFIPVALGQCACSYDEWSSKQYSVDYDRWKIRYENIAKFLEIMFVPFFYRLTNGEFEQLTEIRTCLIDRQRIFEIIRKTGTIATFFCPARDSIFFDFQVWIAGFSRGYVE